MNTPSRIIWSLAGSPTPEGCASVDDRCRMCAQPTTMGMVFDRWQGSSFTDQNKVKCTSSHHICAACIWAHSWVQPPGMEPPPEGKRGLNLRLFSHFWDARGYHHWNNTSDCLSTLPTATSVAKSGIVIGCVWLLFSASAGWSLAAARGNWSITSTVGTSYRRWPGRPADDRRSLLYHTSRGQPVSL